MKLTCSNCSAVAVCGPAEIVSRLRASGMLRREKEPEPDLIAELLLHAADRLICAKCGGQGMSIEPLVDELEDEEWGMSRSCEACGKSIPAERLELFPKIKLCVACQRVEESGGATDKPEYCRKCGALMAIRKRSGGGVARYEMRCTDCGSR